MKKMYKYITIIICCLIIGVTIGYVYSEIRKKRSANISSNEGNVPISNSLNNTNNASLIYSSKSMAPFSSPIVIYNSHGDEEYSSGMNVTDLGSLINDKLNKEGLKSSFIKFDPPIEYAKAYEVTRDVITKNVKDYSDTMLLDIHRDVASASSLDTKKIMFVLVKESPRYEANKKFANLVLKEIENSSSNDIKASIVEYNKGVLHFNQDLSNHSLLIEIGNDKSSHSDIEKCTVSLVSALKNIHSVSLN